MTDRTETTFWDVWYKALEWPELFGDKRMARARAHLLAKNSPGNEVHLMKILSQGIVVYSDKPERATGEAA